MAKSNQPYYRLLKGTGAAWANNRKRTSTHPDFVGDMHLRDGRHMYLAIWKKFNPEFKKWGLYFVLEDWDDVNQARNKAKERGNGKKP